MIDEQKAKEYFFDYLRTKRSMDTEKDLEGYYLRMFPDCVLFRYKEDDGYEENYTPPLVLDKKSKKVYVFGTHGNPLREFLSLKRKLDIIQPIYGFVNVDKEYELIIQNISNQDILFQYLLATDIAFFVEAPEHGDNIVYMHWYSSFQDKLLDELNRLPFSIPYIATDKDLLDFLVYNIQLDFCTLRIREKEKNLNWDGIIW